MRCAGGAAPEISKHPDIVFHAAAAVGVAPANVVQRRLDRLAEAAVDAVGEQGVEAGAFVDLVEVHDRLSLADRLSVGASDRRPIVIVEHPLGEVGSRHQVLQALLILDADRLAAEGLGDPGGGDVHPALIQDLRHGELGLSDPCRNGTSCLS